MGRRPGMEYGLCTDFGYAAPFQLAFPNSGSCSRVFLFAPGKTIFASPLLSRRLSALNSTATLRPEIRRIRVSPFSLTA
jgi:hypothetical protein